jgi:GR25 family glycosyltransferase involved in LPS biosynthesis
MNHPAENPNAEPKTPPKDLWSAFGKIYCISLVERTDRRERAAREFAAVGLGERVEFHVVPKHRDPEQGCYESHLACMKKGVESGAERILIFEDDIQFDRFRTETLENAIAFFENQPNWHMLFLGGMVRRSRRTPHPGILKIRYRSLTHAYVIRRDFAAVQIAKPWHGVPFDDFLRDLADDRSYAVYPSFAFQSDSRSDNERYLPLDRFRRLCGGLLRLQKLDEFLHLHRPLLVAIHVAALLVLAVWLTFR